MSKRSRYGQKAWGNTKLPAGFNVTKVPYRQSGKITPGESAHWKVRAQSAEARLKALQDDIKRRQTTDAFYQSREWWQARYRALKRSNQSCELCGATKESGAILQVDHIKPRSRFPNLALDLANLQVLCRDCNMGKGAWDTTDWRKNPPAD